MKRQTKESIRKEINKEYNEYEKKVEPLRKKIKEIEKKQLVRIFENNKGKIFSKNYGKKYIVLKVLKSINNKGRLVYNQIVIEEKEDYNLFYIKERNTLDKKEAENIFKESIK